MAWIYRLDEVARRLDNGRRVVIRDVIPNGDRVFYRTEDLEDGHTAMFEDSQIRPAFGGRDCEDRAERGR